MLKNIIPIPKKVTALEGKLYTKPMLYTDVPAWERYADVAVDGLSRMYFYDFEKNQGDILITKDDSLRSASYKITVDEKITVSAHSFERALVAFGTSPYHAALAERSMKLALTFLQNTADIRRSGSAAVDLAHVACGRQDVFFEITLKPWDFAAGALLVTEAGGRLMMPFEDGEIRFDCSRGILAANALCAKPALELIESM